jgi:uncharacterized protein (DUF362 family)
MIQRPGVARADGSLRGELVENMVWRAVATALDVKQTRDAFARLFQPHDVVGIKVNCLAGRRMSSRPEVAMALAKGCALAGVKSSNVIIWERSSRELERAGYRIQKGTFLPRVIGTDGVYEKTPIDAGSVGGCLTQIVTRLCTKQINVPVLKDHDLAGVSLGLKNWYGAIHNPNKYHEHQCAPYIADLGAYAPLRSSCSVVVCDALFAQCQGGPAYAPAHMQPFHTILASTDPLALDTVGAHLIEQLRQQRGLPTLQEAGRPPRWLQHAATLGLGASSLANIRVVKA